MPDVYSLRAGHRAVDGIPEGAVYVGRAMPRQRLAGSPWGNPYRVGPDGGVAAIRSYAGWLAAQLRARPGFLDPLQGHDLSCWCRHPSQAEPKAPCHAVILLIAADDPRAWLASFALDEASPRPAHLSAVFGDMAGWIEARA